MTDLDFLLRLSDLTYCNPFTRRRMELEAELLGGGVRPDAWHEGFFTEGGQLRAEVERIVTMAEERVRALVARVAAGGRPDEREWRLVQDAAVFIAYHRAEALLARLLLSSDPAESSRLCREAWDGFSGRLRDLLAPAGLEAAVLAEAGHLFACSFQVRRAFHWIIAHIAGRARPLAGLRAAVWESVFTRDMRRYRRCLFASMGDIPTLVTGPSGSGKELVARAIGLSRHIAFDGRKRAFAEDFRPGFFPVSVAAYAGGLVESELFGHARGAFTGASGERTGLFGACPDSGTVFLDEIGELEPRIQVKLLRVLQNREYQRVGEGALLRFGGKVVAATHRDLAREMEAGRFRPDLYFRLCADTVATPSLREILADRPEELADAAAFVARRLVGPAEAPALADEAAAWIAEHLGPDYGWPGNYRELEQCVRGVLVRGAYRPPAATGPVASSPDADLFAAMAGGRLTAGEVLAAYCRLVHRRTGGNLEATARRLGLDRRTVKARLGAAP